jgi:hypothetical protein
VGFNVKLTAPFVSANGLNMLDEIRRERTVELMAENRRYADLIRWKTAEVELPKAVAGLKYVAGGENERQLTALTDATGKINGVQEYPYAVENIYVFEPAATRSFNAARDYYYPIPQFEIVQSDDNIKQNPIW